MRGSCRRFLDWIFPWVGGFEYGDGLSEVLDYDTCAVHNTSEFRIFLLVEILKNLYDPVTSEASYFYFMTEHPLNTQNGWLSSSSSHSRAV